MKIDVNLSLNKARLAAKAILPTRTFINASLVVICGSVRNEGIDINSNIERQQKFVK